MLVGVFAVDKAWVSHGGQCSFPLFHGSSPQVTQCRTQLFCHGLHLWLTHLLWWHTLLGVARSIQKNLTAKQHWLFPLLPLQQKEGKNISLGNGALALAPSGRLVRQKTDLERTLFSQFSPTAEGEGLLGLRHAHSFWATQWPRFLWLLGQ